MKKIMLVGIIAAHWVIAMENQNGSYQLFASQDQSPDINESRLYKYYLPKNNYTQPKPVSPSSHQKEELWKIWVEKYMDSLPFLEFCTQYENGTISTSNNVPSYIVLQHPSYFAAFQSTQYRKSRQTRIYIKKQS